jgi:Chaperone of endosialidase
MGSSNGGIFGSILGPSFLGLSGSNSSQTQQVKLDPTTQALNMARLQTVRQLPTDQLLQNQQQYYTPSQQAQQYLNQIQQAGQQQGLNPQDWYMQSLQGLNPGAQQEQLSAIAQQRQAQLQSALGQQISGQSAGLGSARDQWLGAGQNALGTGLQGNLNLAQAGYGQNVNTAQQGLYQNLNLANSGYGVGTGLAQQGLQQNLGLANAGYSTGLGLASQGLQQNIDLANAGYGTGVGLANQGLQAGQGMVQGAYGTAQGAADLGYGRGVDLQNIALSSGMQRMGDTRQSNLDYINNVIAPQAIGAGNSYYNQILGPQIGNENALMGLARSGGRQEAEGKGAANIALQLQEELGSLQGQTLGNYQQGMGALSQGYQQGLGQVGQQYAGQLGQASNIYQQGMYGLGSNYQGQLGQVGSQYAGQLGQAGQQYAGQLGQTGLAYQGQLGQAGNQYAGQLGQVGSQYMGQLGQAGNQYSGQLGQASSQYAGQLGAAGQQYAGGLADLQNQAYGQYGQNLNSMYGQAYGQYGQGLQGIGSDLSQGQQAYGQQALQNTYGLNQAYPSMDAALRAAQMGYLQQGYQAADVPRQLGQTGFEQQRQVLASIFNSTPYTPATTTTVNKSGNEGLLNTAFGQGMGQAVGMAAGGSDRKLKKKVKKFSAETVLDELVPYSFEYIDPVTYGTGPQVGIMAQDLEKSELGKSYVLDTPEGKMVYYQNMNSLLLACIVDLHQRVKELESHGV